jgi:hypothetical protein
MKDEKLNVEGWYNCVRAYIRIKSQVREEDLHN